MNPDEALIAQVMLKANGATIHNVKNVIGYYRSCFHLASFGKEEWMERAKEAERKLRKFLVTGEITL